ncbi:MAG: sodium:proton antiporter [Planctomycetota bacterium]|nr:sodium:proton antiporter [Planctomycetota bacterium]
MGKAVPLGTTWRLRARPCLLTVLAAASVLAISAGAALGQAPGAGHAESAAATAAAPSYVPPLWSIAPFALLLLVIAIVPLIQRCAKFWSRNRNKLLVALVLSVPVLMFYVAIHPSMAVREGEHIVELAAGLPILGHVLSAAVLEEFVPFIILLFCLYTISGGIQVRGDLAAHPATNTAFLAAGAVLASIIGTTGAAMLLIRPLLETNKERKHVRHTVIFFIFIVCNIGGCLLPTGDPPLFLGYLMGVPFLWTLGLAAEWAIACGILLIVYYVWDTAAYRREAPQDIARDEASAERLGVRGKINLVYLLGVVLAVALLVPGEPLVFYRGFIVPPYLREGVMLAVAALSLLTTPRGLREANQFTFSAIAEVAALFLGIFITMQAPIEMLRVCGPTLGMTEPWQFFWASGGLSSFLDNAPTYVVFFETANSLTTSPGQGIMELADGQFIRLDLLVAVSLGAVFMGANTYIGNGPNFMVKAIAEERGIRMPSFFGYMLYSVGILIPIFLALTFVFFVLKWV